MHYMYLNYSIFYNIFIKNLPSDGVQIEFLQIEFLLPITLYPILPKKNFIK